MSVFYGVLLLVLAQRLTELALARRNARRLRRAGAVEAGAGHYPLFIILHGGWLLALATGVPADAAPNLPLLAAFLAVQVLRVWVLASLGRFWTTRILTLPGVPLVRRGPYRWLRHPNYLVVALEIPLLPLAFEATSIAVIFGTLNLLLLAWRIRVEDAALAPRRGMTGAA